MIDAVIIGGGHSGTATAKQLLDAGLTVTVVDIEAVPPTEYTGEWITGKAVLSRSGLVAILDPQTGDERRLLQAKAIITAIGILAPENLPAMTLGITKFGVQLTSSKDHIICNSSGETGAPGIYATGSCASQPTPGIADSVIKHCTTSLAER